MDVKYCPQCLTIVENDTPVCEACDSAKPRDGWRLSSHHRYAWLGEVIDDRYKMVQYLSFGSTGEVYRAVSLRTGRWFAAKIIDKASLPRYVDFNELSERLIREVTVLGSIRSPHVVAAVDFLQADEELFVIVMDLATGDTLERILHDQGHIPIPRALDIFEQLLEAVSEAHEQNVIHRDLKPENIVVRTLKSGRPFVYLLDFGAAKLIDDPKLTHGFIGTPLYSAPEQIRNAALVDERADIYSLVCILFAMLTGGPPFSANDGTEVMRMHLQDPIPRLPFSSGLPEMDRALADFFDRGLAKDREERFSSIAEVLTSPIFELSSLLTGVARRLMTSPTATPLILSDIAEPTKQRSAKVSVPSHQLHQVAKSKDSAQATEHDPPCYVTLNMSGDLAAKITTKGMLSLWSALDEEIKQELQLPLSGGAEPLQLTFGPKGHLLWLSLSDGTIYSFDARTLSVKSVDNLKAPPLWIGTSSLDHNDLILISYDRVSKWSPMEGTIAMVPVDREIGPSMPIVSRDGNTIQAYFREHEEGLSILESHDDLTLHWLPASPLKRTGTPLLDVSGRSRLLLNVDGNFTELNLENRYVKSLHRVAETSWKSARWSGRRDAFYALTESGDLYFAQADEAPQKIAVNIACINATKDKSRLLSASKTGSLSIWEPQRPGSASGTISVSPADPAPSSFDQLASRSETKPTSKGAPSGGTQTMEVILEPPTADRQIRWDFLGNSNSVACWASDEPDQLNVHSSNTWTAHKLSPGAPLLDLRWSQQGQVLGAMREDGELLLIKGKKTKIIRETVTGENPLSAALYDIGDGLSVAYGDNTIHTWAWSARDNAMSPGWRRRMDKPILTLRGSRRAGILLVAHDDFSASLLELETGSRRSSIPPGMGDIRDFCVSTDGHMFALLRSGYGVEVYDTHAARLTFKLPVNLGNANRVWLGADGSLLVGHCTSRFISITNVATSTEQLRLTLPTSTTK